MINFALVQLSKKHTEIFGTFIEIIKYFKWELTIYYDKDNDPYTFLNYYNKLFDISLNINQIANLENNRNKHDYFIFTTSSDSPEISEFFKKEEISDRCIFVNHNASNYLPYMKKNIQMSPIINLKDNLNPNIKSCCIIPYYRQYNKIHSNYNSKNIAIIGAIRPNLDLNIYIFMRKIDWKVISNRNKFLKNNPYIKFYPGLSTNLLIEKLNEIKFILPLSQKDGWFYWQRLTGTIPLAINLNIPLVIDEKLAKIYNLENCGLLYENRIIEILDSIKSISEEDYYKMVENIVIYKKKQSLINRKNFLDLCMSK